MKPVMLSLLVAAAVSAAQDKQTFTGRLLGCRALVAIGLVSYSAYLWHQPIFAFARLHWLREPSAGPFLLRRSDRPG